MSCNDWTTLRSPANDAYKQDRIINCTGTHFEIGHTHGSEARSKILEGIRNYAALFEESVNLSWAAAKVYAARFLPALERHVPHLLEEMRGIAEGARVSLEDILALNARSEIGLTRPKQADPPDGCTAFARHVDEQQWLQQNWDWKANQIEQVVILRIQEPCGNSITTITEAGLVAKVGMNSQGVGVTLNALKTVQMNDTMLPIHVALRLVLESDSAEDAHKRLEVAGVASAAHFLLADGGSSMGLEVNPVRPFGRIEPTTDGNIFHTNHCVARNRPEALTEIPWLQDSPVRLDRIAKLVHDLQETSFETISKVFQDEQGLPNAINRDVDPETGTGICTIFTAIMNCTRKELRVTIGRPTAVLETYVFDCSASSPAGPVVV
ncbi:putative Acyl-CoA:6-aminopenicillanic-acid-acyltransferase [Taphrina deformans PYCC 5710]|uniref:Acyl-CoA:6-aminopenicillanic-acid-acyltransferase n=1 Tax=Taphrina deformans (strain PYCC 5710 / ATCC 11124 / CBS 356.35 / IMI 108563 / JCM 9778 / NBRC 8474) TaxID=1097556 RepID=R5A1M9_TAPDE|nr:putative Acyl-CoA:6-aminopenicillanic-acid-acyltransferase [Taphrina deformans PYCC 5710]|eukprot:CCX35417.1 putative Acyl-CoA:6-aminopenicillanic-acid-acyltransferase [Taphrina deformans PYCC 5710]